MPFRSINEMKQEGDVQGLIAALANRSTAQRAVEALGELGAPAAEATVQAMANQPDMNTYLMGIAAVMKIGAPCLPALNEAVNRTETPNRGGAAAALGMIAEKITDQDQLEPLVEPLTRAFQDSRPYVREAAVGALGRVGQQLNDRATRSLIKARLEKFQADPEKKIARAAVEGLERLEKPSPAETAAVEAQANAELAALTCPRCQHAGSLVRFKTIYERDPAGVRKALELPEEPELDKAKAAIRRSAARALWIAGLAGILGGYLYRDLQTGLGAGLALGLLAYFLTRLAYSIRFAQASARFEQAAAAWQKTLYCQECQQFIERDEFEQANP